MVGLGWLLIVVCGAISLFTLPTLPFMFVMGAAASGKTDGAGLLALIVVLPLVGLVAGIAMAASGARKDKSAAPRATGKPTARGYARRHS